jgi:hypothetical protein
VRIEIDAQTGHVTVTSGGQTVSGGQSVSGGQTALDGEPGADNVSFGIFGGLGAAPLADLRASITDGLKTAAGQLTEAVTHLLNEVSTLEVATYSSEDLSGVGFDTSSGHLVGAVRRRALTRMRLDGHTVAIVPEDNGKVDAEMWAIHCQLVERAQAQRAEMLKASLAAVSNLLGALKGF